MCPNIGAKTFDNEYFETNENNYRNDFGSNISNVMGRLIAKQFWFQHTIRRTTRFLTIKDHNQETNSLGEFEMLVLCKAVWFPPAHFSP